MVEDRALGNVHQALAGLFVIADEDMASGARSRQDGAAAAAGGSGQGVFNADLDAAVGQRPPNKITFPVQIGLACEMLDRAAAAGFKVPADRFDPLGLRVRKVMSVARPFAICAETVSPGNAPET